jgi:hypothetical protein
VTTQGPIAKIVNKWRLKYEFTPGKYRNLPYRDGPPGPLNTFLDRMDKDGQTDLLLFVSTDHFYD